MHEVGTCKKFRASLNVSSIAVSMNVRHALVNYGIHTLHARHLEPGM